VNPNGYAGKVGQGTVTPVAAFHSISTAYGDPSLIADTNDSQVLQTGAGGQFVFGQYGTSPYALWLQGKREGSGTAYYLALQPLGGNVGIGTASPDVILHASGAGQGTSSGMYGAVAKFYSTVGNGSVVVSSAPLYSGYLLGVDAAAAGNRNWGIYNGADTAGTLVIKRSAHAGTDPIVDDGGAGIVIDNAGRVGIGTVSPGSTLEVAGTGIKFSSTSVNGYDILGAWGVFTSSWTGFGLGADPTCAGYYMLEGKKLSLDLQCAGSGTSNSAVLGFQLPVLAKRSNSLMFGVGMDNGSVQSTAVECLTSASSAWVYCYKDPSGTAWTTSGNKRIIRLAGTIEAQ
jgi:hypothetical protein